MSELREQLGRIQKKIDEIKPEYKIYDNKLMLNKEEAVRKAEIGHELYRLNIEAIGLLNEIDREEGSKKRLSDNG